MPSVSSTRAPSPWRAGGPGTWSSRAATSSTGKIVPCRLHTPPSAVGAVDFWDLTNKQDWGACESVQRGLASPHFRPGPFAPNEDAVADLVSRVGRAYRVGRLEP